MRSGRKTLLWIGLGLSLLCCLGVGVPIWGLINGRDGLDHQLVEYRKRGLPWTAGEVSQDRGLPESLNAGPLISRLSYDLSFTKSQTDTTTAWKDAMNGEFASSAVVKKYAGILALAKRAAGMSFADFHRDWDMGPEILFPEMARAKTLVRLLLLRAMLEAHSGNPRACNDDLATSWCLGTLVGQEPTLIAMLVEISIRALVMTAAEHVIYIERSQPASLESLRETLRKMTDEPDFALSMRGEAYMGLTILRNGSIFRSRVMQQSSGGGASLPPVDPRRLQRDGRPTGLFERVMGGKVIQTCVERSDIAMRDGKDFRKLDADLKELERKVERDKSITSAYRGMIAPVFTHIGEQMLRDRANRITVAALLEAVLLKARTGRYPKKISDLKGVWIDPFDGEKLRMTQDETEIRFYSVGADLKDDGGRSQSETRGMSTSFDIPAACPPVSRVTK